MLGPTKYILVSLPTSISQSNDRDEALTALRSTVSTDNGTVLPFKIPEFKIGTLDALVQQADDLAKLEGACQGVVSKVGDSLRSLLEGDEEKIAQQKTVNDSRFRRNSRVHEVLKLTCGTEPADQYLRTFSWNKVKYRADKPLAELIDSLQKVRDSPVYLSSGAKYSNSRSWSVSITTSRVKSASTTRSRQILRPYNENRRECLEEDERSHNISLTNIKRKPLYQISDTSCRS